MKTVYIAKSFIHEYQLICEFIFSRALLPVQLEKKTCILEFKCEQEETNLIKELESLLSARDVSKVYKLTALFSKLKELRKEGRINNLKIVCKEEIYNNSLSIDIKQNKDKVIIEFSPNVLVFINILKLPYKLPEDSHVIDGCSHVISSFYSCKDIFDLDYFFYDVDAPAELYVVEGHIFYVKPEYGDFTHKYVIRSDVFLSNILPVINIAKKSIIERTKINIWDK